MEKKNKNIGIIIILILLFGIGVWFWLSGKKGDGDGGFLSGEKTESLSDVLTKAAGITSLKYDMVATAPGQAAITMKMWLKGQKTRMEGTFDGQEVVYLLNKDKQISYMYIPLQNMAMEMDLSKAQESVGEPPSEQSESVAKYNPVILDTEVLDGKICLVIEYTTETEKVKMWIWKEHGLPIKTETTTTKGTSVVELKNIDFGNISDSVFELPAGVQIVEIPIFGL